MRAGRLTTVALLVGCARPPSSAEEIVLETGIAETEVPHCPLEARIAGVAEVLPGEELCLWGSCECASTESALEWGLVDIPYNSNMTMTSSTTASERFDQDQPELCLVPDVPGYFDLSLRCVDETRTASASVIVESLADHEPPIAHAGPDTSGLAGEPISLSGAASYDPEGAALSYHWVLRRRPTGSASSFHGTESRAACDTSFTGDVAGDYVVGLNVFDGEIWSFRDEATLTLD